MSLVVRVLARGANPTGLVSYLANNKVPHENQRIVAGSVKYPGHLDKAMVKQVGADLRYYQQMNGTKVPKGHVYHVSLSVSPDNGQLSDARWQSIANDFMAGMRFTGPNVSPIRWTAINHGANEAGADHIHIAMSLVRENGRQVNLHNDRVRMSALATKLERKYSLGVLESRLATVGAGARPYSSKDLAVAQRAGRTEPDQVRLERDIRALAGQARTEAEFIHLVQKDGLLIAPFPRNNGLVTGYSVALPAAAGAKPGWFGGGKLAKDLTLPQLRRRWPSMKESALRAWRANHADESGEDAAQLTEAAAKESLDVLGESIAEAGPVQFAEDSHDLAGVLAAASKVLEAEPGALAKASRDVGGWAQPAVMPTGPILSRAGARLFILSLDPGGERGRSVMFRQFAETMLELYRLHQIQRLRAATRRQVGRMDDANPAAEMTEDGVTLMATGGMLAVMNSAKQKRQQEQQEAADGAALTEGDATVFSKKGHVRSDGSTDLIDRDFFRDYRQKERADREVIRERGRQERAGIPQTPELMKIRQENLERLQKLSEQVGVPLEMDTLNAVPDDMVKRMLHDYESAAQDFGLPPIQTSTYDVVASQVVGPHGVQNGAQAIAFLEGLESRAAQRQAAADLAAFEADLAAAKAGEAPWVDPDVMHEAPAPADVERMRSELATTTDCAPLLSEAQVVDLNQRMHAAGIHPQEVSAGPAWQHDSNDPRNWDTAYEPVSPKQRARLIEAGFSHDEIQTLQGKGEASVIVGDYLGPVGATPDKARARAAYDRILDDSGTLPSVTDTARQARPIGTASESTTTPKPVAQPRRVIRPPVQ